MIYTNNITDIMHRDKSIFDEIKRIYDRHLMQAEAEKIVWYLRVIILIPCVYMVLSILAMNTMLDNIIWFVPITMILFFVNVMIHIAALSSKYFVPIYYATVGVFIFVPIITYFIR